MELKDLLETAQALALANKLAPNEEAAWNRVARAYSKTFHTPLHEVVKLDPEQVALAYYEEQMESWKEDEHMEDILDLIYGLQDPNYDANKEKELREQYKRIEEEEAIRIADGRAIHHSLEKKAPTEKTLPKGGSLDLSYMGDKES